MMSDQPCMTVAVVDKTERLTSFAVLSVIATDGKQWLEQFRRNRVFIYDCWGLSAGYQPRPQVVDRGTTARYGGQLRYI